MHRCIAPLYESLSVLVAYAIFVLMTLPSAPGLLWSSTAKPTFFSSVPIIH